MTESEIRLQLTSNDDKVLSQSLNFINELIEIQQSRSKRAEERAGIMLAVVGVLTGFAVNFTDLLLEPGQNGWILLLTLYAGSVLFLVKTGTYAISALMNQKIYSLTPKVAFNIQCMNTNDALREELTWKIWVHDLLIPVGTKRLVRVGRAQRNVFASIVMIGLFGLISYLLKIVDIPVSICINVSVIVIVIFSIVYIDTMTEKLGNMWHK